MDAALRVIRVEHERVKSRLQAIAMEHDNVRNELIEIELRKETYERELADLSLADLLLCQASAQKQGNNNAPE